MRNHRQKWQMKTMELSNNKQHLSEQIIHMLKQLELPRLVRIGTLSLIVERNTTDCYGDILSEIDVSIFVHETFVFNIYIEQAGVYYYSGSHVYNNIQVLQSVVEELQKRLQEKLQVD